MPLYKALRVRDGISHGKYPPGVDPKIGVEPVDIYIAGRFGNFIRDPKARSSPFVAGIIAPPLRAEAESIVAAHPNPTSAEMDTARAALARALDSKGNLSITHRVEAARDDLGISRYGMTVNIPGADLSSWQICSMGAVETFVCAALFSVAAALLFRGGLLLRALGITVVRRDGEDASRVRMFWRACVAWSWMPLGITSFSTLKPLTGESGAIAIVAPLVLGVIAWSAARPGRSLQDRLSGTWLVPR
jgi:hypothetical protein